MNMLHWTQHARMKMNFYRLSPARVRRVLHSPKRVEEGVAPDTVAMMQPVSMKTKDSWTQEIWVMVEDIDKTRNVISAWRYPGMTKARSVASSFIRKEYNEFIHDTHKSRL